jgi:alpha-L-arabinofuranosidase
MVLAHSKGTPNMTLSASIRIDPQRGKTPINRMIYGQFLEHFHRQVYGGVYEPGSPLAGPDGLRRDVIDALRELRIPIVRWPGGCFVSAYHWKDGIGPRRQPAYDKAWRVEDPNTFGTDEFVAWCRLIGAEPYICTNAGTGSPEEMSDWVEYCNLTSAGFWAKQRQANGMQEPHQVHYWSIGNENYGSWEMGAKTAQEWGRFVTESAKMMKRVDPSICLLAAALPDLDWTLNLLRQAGSWLDMVSIHGYYDPLWQKDEPAGYADCILRSGEVENTIRLTEQVIAVAGFAGKMGIAFDEWNLRGWHHPNGNTPQAIGARDRNDLNATYTMADAVFSAGFLNTCLRHAATVQMANLAPVINTRGALFVHAGGVVRRTTFHIMAMYANQLGAFAADCYVQSDPFEHNGAKIPALDAVATCDEAQQSWRLALVNRHPDQPLSCRMCFDGQPQTGTVSVHQLQGDSPDAYNDIDNPERVHPESKNLTFEGGAVTLPPHSVTILSLELP